MALDLNLFHGGDFEQSTGVGASSVLIGGPKTDYIADGSLFVSGNNHWGFFTTNAGQITNGDGVPIKPLGARSVAANVSNDASKRLFYWDNVPLVNGARYRVGFRSAIIYRPYGLAFYVDGVQQLAFPDIGQPVQTWTLHESEFVWSGTTGKHTVSFRSTVQVLPGNDHCFDLFELERVDSAPNDMRCVTVPVCYEVAGEERRGYADMTKTPVAFFDAITDAQFAPENVSFVDCNRASGWYPVALEPHLRVMSISWGIPLPIAADEENGNFTPIFTGSLYAVSTNPGYWHPPYPSGAVLAPCDAGTMMEFDWRGAPTESVEWTYRRDPNSDTPTISGNTFYWSVPGVGIANFDFGVHAAGSVGIGQALESAEVNGYRARLTLISVGNIQDGARWFSTGNTPCGNGRLHAHPDTDVNTDLPQRYRIEFFKWRP